jgi:TonB-linked SusC/RagA family outer membrane protein
MLTMHRQTLHAVAAVATILTYASPAAALRDHPLQRVPVADSGSRAMLYRVDTRTVPALQKPISISLRSAKLDDALHQIAASADLPLTYSRNVLPRGGRVSLTANGILVEDALRAVLKDAGLDIMALSTGQVVVVRAGERPAAPPPPVGAIVGRVSVVRTAGGLSGVSVSVEGTRLGAITGDSGQYRIAGVAPGPHTVLARRLGYAPLRQSVTVPGDGDVTLDFTLEPAATSLDQVVVTGTVGGEQQRALGNSVATLDAAQARELSGAADVTKLLNGRVPGLAVLPTSGKVGAGPQLNIRGRSTLSLSGQPILYLDGVRVANDIGTGPASAGGTVASRINDINPEDIERIEVIKGPAAATLYGTEASNGVIQIITKKGKTGQARWDLSIRQGSSWFMDAEQRIGLAYARDPQTSQILTFNPVADAKASGTPIFENGRIQSYDLAVSGGNEAIRYYAAGNREDDKGVDPTNKYRRYGGHANLGLSPTSTFDVSVSVNAVVSTVDLTPDFGGGMMFSAMFGSPLLKSTPTRGFLIAPPEIFYSGIFQNTQDVDRYTVSVQANHRPATWFRQRVSLGLDQTGEDNIALVTFMGPSAAKFFASQAKGSINDARRDLTFQTADYSATAEVPVATSLKSSTSVGGQFYRRDTHTITVAARDFPGPGVTTARAAAVPQTTQTDQIKNTTVGVFGQQQLAWRDRVFITGAVRIDNNSAFGTDFKWVTYPKVSASWVASEEPFFHVPLVSTLKFRAAYGASGEQPGVFTALRTYNVTAGPNDVSAITPAQVGNPKLKPERGEELEAGLDASLLAGRLGVDFTYFNKKVHDAILLKPNAPSFGFPGTQFMNVGRVDNHGLELRLTGKALDRPSLGLDLGFNVATASDKVRDLGGLPFVDVFALLGQRNVVGYPIGAFFAKKVVSAQLDNAGKAINVLCDGGDANNHQPIACAQAPRVFLGTPTPKTTGSGTATLRLFNKLQLYAMVDFKNGHRAWDWDRNIRCVQIPNCEVLVAPQKYDPRYVAEVQNGTGQVIASQFIANSSFTKLREISASYELPANLLHRAGASKAVLSIAGRNLHTWTDWTGIDPESRSPLFALSEVVNLSQSTIPPLAEFVVSLRLSF